MRDQRHATDAASFTVTTVRLVGSLLIWGTHFAVIYAGTALVCARGTIGASLLGIGILTWIIAAATLAALVCLLWLCGAALTSLRSGTHPRGSTPWFLGWVTAVLGVLAAVAIVWEALPLLIVRPCA